MKRMLRKYLILITLLATAPSFGFTYQAHQNMPEDGLIFMEQHGTLQMRWAFDYLKAKTNGRHYEEGTQGDEVCYDYIDPNGHASGDPWTGADKQCGILGVGRSGGIAPDFFRDNFWDDATTWNYHFEIAGNEWNFTSWSHFINLLETSEAGTTLVTNNHNDYDGYSWQSSYGFPDWVGIDGGVATFMNNAWMTVDLANCTECNMDGGKYTPQPNGNPATDYKQNGSTTPVLAAGNGGKRSAVTDGSNYNCFSDVDTIGNCPDQGRNINNEGSDCGWLTCDEPDPPMQIPNVDPGGGNISAGNEDWIIYEPADNTSTFFYNEMFLEGGVARNGSFDAASVTGRYYTIPADDVKYLATIMHWAGDMNQQSHIWSTIGYNHSEYESRVDATYGQRVVGGSASENFEDFDNAKAYFNARVNRYNESVQNIYMEQAFLTYHVRLRSGYDTLTSASTTTQDTAGTWAVNNAIPMIAILYEKGVMDLRKYRQ